MEICSVSQPVGEPDTAGAALFDLGGVLIEWDPARTYREVFASELTLVERFLIGPLTEVGLTSCEAPGSLDDIVRPFLPRYPEFHRLLDYFANHWSTFVQGPMLESVALLARLRAAGVPLYGLTNWPAATFPPNGSRFDFLNWFSGIVVSGVEGMRKPGDEIFHRTTRRFALQPSATVYVDDHRGNVETAARLGFRTHHFADAAGLEVFLLEQGLLPPASADG